MRVFDPIDILSPPSDEVRKAGGRAALAKWLLSEGHKRRALFPTIMLDDAGWEMMLDLFVQAQTGCGLATTSLCVAASVPLSTAIRHVNHLSSVGILERTADDRDRRRVMVSLSEETRTKITEYLDYLSGAMRAQAVRQ